MIQQKKLGFHNLFIVIMRIYYNFLHIPLYIYILVLL